VNAEFNWWLLIVGLVVGAGLVWLVMADSRRREVDVSEAERDGEAQWIAEAMIEAGILLGLSREISTQLVVQTMFGTAKQLRDMKMHPVELREMVTSPGGTTIAAIRELEIAGVRAAFLNAIQAAMNRARELASDDQ
jgi:hypothetical protein